MIHKKVRIIDGEAFKTPPYAKQNEYIGVIAYEEPDNDQALVRLAPKFHGWGKDHGDFDRLCLEHGYTYWWVSKERLELVSVMETE